VKAPAIHAAGHRIEARLLAPSVTGLSSPDETSGELFVK
jgi:hypothetical protein